MMIRKYLWLVLCLVVQSAFGQRNHFKHYGLEDGLPQSQVFDVLQDSRGFLWVGTRGGGMARFDGNQFKSLSTKQGLINNFVNCIYEDSEGDIWVGTRAGLSHYNGLGFENFTLSELGETRVFCLKEVDSVMLVGTSKGLFTLTDSMASPITGLDEQENFYINDIEVYLDTVYIGSNRGLFLLEKHSWEVIRRVSRSDGLPDDYIQSLEPDSTGMWVGTYGRGARYLTSGKVHNPYLPIPRNTICYDLKREGNMLWMATQSNGAFLYNLKQKKLKHYTLATGLSNNHVRSIEKDRWGNTWLGTSGGGLSQFAGQQFNHLTKRDGLADNYIYSAFEDASGALWIGTGRKGVVRRDSNGYVTYGRDSGFANVKVKAICQGRDSTLWFGTEGRGLAYLRDSVFRWITTRDGLCGNYIKDIECARDGSLWVATLDGGISEISMAKKGFKFKNYRYLTEIPSNRIYALSIDDKKTVWFG
ncbi:MAG: hypothetical protein JJ975_14750, partial [Bacteroidia bacterium]|nr:hypothetical protein [Bacteroidia bacterium]